MLGGKVHSNESISFGKNGQRNNDTTLRGHYRFACSVALARSGHLNGSRPNRALLFDYGGHRNARIRTGLGLDGHSAGGRQALQRHRSAGLLRRQRIGLRADARVTENSFEHNGTASASDAVVESAECAWLRLLIGSADTGVTALLHAGPVTLGALGRMVARGALADIVGTEIAVVGAARAVADRGVVCANAPIAQIDRAHVVIRLAGLVFVRRRMRAHAAQAHVAGANRVVGRAGGVLGLVGVLTRTVLTPVVRTFVGWVFVGAGGAVQRRMGTHAVLADVVGAGVPVVFAGPGRRIELTKPVPITAIVGTNLKVIANDRGVHAARFRTTVLGARILVVVAAEDRPAATLGRVTTALITGIGFTAIPFLFPAAGFRVAAAGDTNFRRQGAGVRVEASKGDV